MHPKMRPCFTANTATQTILDGNGMIVFQASIAANAHCGRENINKFLFAVAKLMNENHLMLCHIANGEEA